MEALLAGIPTVANVRAEALGTLAVRTVSGYEYAIRTNRAGWTVVEIDGGIRVGIWSFSSMIDVLEFFSVAN